MIVLSVMLFASCAFADDSTVGEFTKIRMEYAKRADFDPCWEHDDDRKKITDLWVSDKIDEGVRMASQWLEKHPVDAKMHLWYAYELRKRGDFRGYFKHKLLYQGLLASITSSGSGLSMDSPMKVISVSEEYSILRALDAKLIQQSLISSKSGIRCDEMECEIGGEKTTLYFDVSISMAHIEKVLNPKGMKTKTPSSKSDAGDGK